MAFGFFVVALSAHHTIDSYPKEIAHTSEQWRVFFIEEEQKKTAKFYKYEAIFEQHQIVLFSKKPLVKNAFYLVKSHLSEVENFSSTFDYKTHLAKKGIRYQSWVTTAHYLYSSKKLSWGGVPPPQTNPALRERATGRMHLTTTAHPKTRWGAQKKLQIFFEIYLFIDGLLVERT